MQLLRLVVFIRSRLISRLLLVNSALVGATTMTILIVKSFSWRLAELLGIGGPLINRYGEVIGMCFHDPGAIAFLPINIASIWWEHYKKYGQSRQPWLEMEVTNLYTADLDILENIIPKFPDVLKGVIVEEVVPGSSAESAGIKHNDVIIQFAGKRVHSFLELFENMWNNVGESVELAVIRSSHDSPVQLSMVVEEVT